MHVPCCYDEGTTEERHGGHATVFKGEGRGRQVAIKVVRLYLTNELETPLSVCPFQPYWRRLFLIQLLELLQGSRFLETPSTSKYSAIAWREFGKAEICDDIRVDG